MKKLIVAVMAFVGVIAAFAPVGAHADALTTSDYTTAITNTVAPVQTAIVSFLSNGWLTIVGVMLLVAFVVLAWTLVVKAFHRLRRVRAV